MNRLIKAKPDELRTRRISIASTSSAFYNVYGTSVLTFVKSFFMTLHDLLSP
jgi:hypothetical protein